MLKKSAATVAADNLSHLAFDNGAEASIIITVSTGKICMANSACSKLLGYSKKELLTKNRADIFDIKESSFKLMLKQRAAEGQSKAMVFAIKKNGKQLPCEITSAIFTAENGIKTSITTITDVTKRLLDQKKLDKVKQKTITDDIVRGQAKQKRIDYRKQKIIAADNLHVQLENDTWKKYIGKTSFDVMWDWNVITGEIYVGDSVEEVFGYKIKGNELTFENFKQYLQPKEKTSIERKILAVINSSKMSWKASFSLKRKDGVFTATVSRAKILRDASGKALHWIGAIKDISKQLELENKVKELLNIENEDSEKFSIATRLSFDAIWDWNLLTGEVFRGEGFNELLGKSKKGIPAQVLDFKARIHPDDYEAVESGLNKAIASSDKNWEDNFRFIRNDGSLAKVLDRACIMRDAEGKAYRMVGILKDLSLQMELEEKLSHEVKLKEKQITDAAEDAKEMERSNIGKELHDNINQLLGASRMYLEMAKKGGGNSAMYLSRSSEYTLNAIEEIRKLTKGLTTDIIKGLGLGIAIEELAADMAEVNAIKIVCSLQGFNEKSTEDKFKLNIFRIVQEHLNNILKHAKATKITIGLVQDEQAVKLSITDNGVGFDTNKRQKGIGIDNIKSRAASYNGEASFISRPGNGCTLNVIFPVAA